MSRAAPSGGRSPRQREGSDAATAVYVARTEDPNDQDDETYAAVSGTLTVESASATAAPMAVPPQTFLQIDDRDENRCARARELAERGSEQVDQDFNRTEYRSGAQHDDRDRFSIPSHSLGRAFLVDSVFPGGKPDPKVLAEPRLREHVLEVGVQRVVRRDKHSQAVLVHAAEGLWRVDASLVKN